MKGACTDRAPFTSNWRFLSCGRRERERRTKNSAKPACRDEASKCALLSASYRNPEANFLNFQPISLFAYAINHDKAK
jgi:hypothetical protein